MRTRMTSLARRGARRAEAVRLACGGGDLTFVAETLGLQRTNGAGTVPRFHIVRSLHEHKSPGVRPTHCWAKGRPTWSEQHLDAFHARVPRPSGRVAVLRSGLTKLVASRFRSAQTVFKDRYATVP